MRCACGFHHSLSCNQVKKFIPFYLNFSFPNGYLTKPMLEQFKIDINSLKLILK